MSNEYVVKSGSQLGIVASGEGWQDIIGPMFPRPSGGTVPTFEQVSTTGFFANKFQVNDEAWFAFHIPHDYIPGTDMYVHAHWFPEGTATNSVKWEFAWASARGYGAAAFNIAAPTTVSVTTTPSGVTRTHYISEVAMGSSGFEVDELVWVRVRRVTNGGTDNANSIYMLMTDCHYRSNGVPTKNRNPNFYT